MSKAEKNQDQDFERIEKILPLQEYPYGVTKHLKRIAKDIGEHGLTWVLIKVYCFGVIAGKQEERKRRGA